MTDSLSLPSDAAGVGPGWGNISYQIRIDKASPTLTVSSSSSSIIYGSPVTLTATLSGGYSPSGTITFYANGTSVGTANLSGTTASLTINSLPVGSDAITASYSGNSNNNSATSGSTTVTVAQITPSIALAASSTSASYGSSVALVATLTGGASPSGTVTFLEGATQLGSATISGTTAILAVSSLSVGPHTITATYNGDTTNASVTSGSITVTITQDAPTVTLGASSTSTSAGDPVTLVASLSGGTSPGCSVTFYDGATSLGSGTVSGSAAMLTVSSLSTGSHTITAVYGGDSHNAGATSNVMTVTVGSASLSVSISSSSLSPTLGQSVIFTATLSGGSSPSGSVTFKDGSTTLGAATISGSTATFTTSSLAVGAHPIAAIYGGDGSNGSASSGTITVTVGKVSPSLTVSSSSSSPTVGQSVTFTATLSGGSSPSGSVTFQDGATVLGSATISGASAALTTSAFTVGTHAITAVYGGDGSNATATSSAIMVTVGQASPSVSLSASSAAPAVGQSVTFTATLSGGSSPSGTVTFQDGATVLGSAAIAGSSASLATAALAVGTHTITAVYGGDSGNAGATSTVVTVTVGKSSASLALVASSTSPSAGQSVTFTATVSGGSSAGGTVTFNDGATILGSAAISGTTATFTTAALAIGTHSITAAYGGDSNNAAATSGAVTVTVAKVLPSISVSASLTSPAAGQSVVLTAVLSGGSSPSGSVTFKDGTTTLGTATISGATATLATSTLVVGFHSLTAIYGGDSSNALATSSTIAVTIGKAAPSIAVSSSASAPAAGQSVTLTASLSGGASPTGSVSFKDGTIVLGTATISGSAASFTTLPLASGAHSIVAIYAGDGNNAAATSIAISLTVGRSDPGTSAAVRGTVASQVSTAVRFGQAQIGNIFQRLEGLHDADDGAPGSGPIAAAGPSGPSASNSEIDRRAAGLFNDRPAAAQALGYSDELPIRTNLTSQSDAGRAVNQLAAALPQAVERINKANLLPFNVWAFGTVGFGRLQGDNSYDNRFTSSGLTLGFDRTITDGLKAGAAFGLGFDHNKIGTDGSRIDARSFNATIYASWNFLPHTYLDVAGGYGWLRFDGKRWSNDGNVMLDSQRAGSQLFGTVGVSHVSRWEGWKLSSYGRFDVVNATLNTYNETGSSQWALSYDRMNTTSVAGVLGGRLAYPILQSWGVLTPAVRAEWRHAFDGGYVQGLNYVDLVGLTSGYALSGTSTARDTMTGGLSLRADVGNALSLDLEYLLTSSLNGVESQRLRGAMKYGF
ncbi:Ig-like domain repeat protein [Bradyrhizobium sp. Arg816]|uniref:Ig-like domain repeat protein n=1 Tax=Bradyrhizobium sp. Arg816 TaxID=2998491 RepID=UPI00249EC8D6|nr:Ig-like domain repeat protein [Bradyrhizobium sp. Arg816]MDI3563428.1 Ig-like domain repeat protein [Bradyrhizobium sp. Arg816]